MQPPLAALDADRLCALLETVALEAGSAIMAVFRSDAGHATKPDLSPVTIADERAEAIICKALKTTYPDIPIVAEEHVSAGFVPPELGRRFFLVDPLDGTREFINRRPDFTVNIALVEDGAPAFGVVYAPASDVLYLGAPHGAMMRRLGPEAVDQAPLRIAVRPRTDGMVAVASRSHRTAETDAYLATQAVTECISIGSSLKFCLLAEGKADIYPRFGRTMEWDTAAGDAVLRAAGGRTLRIDGQKLTYGKRNQPEDADFANPHFIAAGA